MPLYTLIKAKKHEVISPDMAKQMLRIFKAFYKKGVNDAFAAEDEGLCRELIEATSKPCTWGLLGVRTTDNYNWWENRIADVADEIGNGAYTMLRGKSGKNGEVGLFVKIGRYSSNYLSAFLVLCQCMYNRGIDNYCKWPSAMDLTAYNSKTEFGWWTDKGYKKAPNDRIVSYLQDCSMERADIDAEDVKKGLRKMWYESYNKAIGLALLQSYK